MRKRIIKHPSPEQLHFPEEMPEKPEFPLEPEMPEIPDEPQEPELPEIPEEPGLEDPDLPGYPEYPPGEDIYLNLKKEQDLDPEDINLNKESLEKIFLEKNNEKSFEEDITGSDLDVPGTELDDESETVGSEDEENNYYSIGGDNHSDLEEDKGE
jgi:hypothetical protein